MHLRRACFGVLLVGMTGLFCGSVLRAQSAAAPATAPVAAFQSDVRVALVDVVVTDKKGDPVPALHAADFQILEDGKPQAISSFEEHKGVPARRIKLPPMPPGVFTNYPTIATADSVNVLLVDTLNTSTLDQAFVRQQVLKYIKTIPPGAIAVFVLGTRLRMVQGFTTDHTALLAAVNDKALLAISPLLQSPGEKEAIRSMIGTAEGEHMGPGPADLAAAAVDPSNALREMMAEETAVLADQQVAVTMQALQQLGRYLAGFPGRKNVIWLSASFPFRLMPDESLANPFRAVRNFQEELRKTADLLTTAQVAVYPVSAEGLVGESAYSADTFAIGEKGGRRTGIDDLYNRRFSMEELARDTGGQAFANTNGLKDVLERVTKNGMHYYSLSYVPTNKSMDGKYRRISVRLTKQKYNLFYRRGYYALDSEQRKSAEQKLLAADPLLRLVSFAAPEMSQIVFKVRIAPLDPQPAAGAARAGVNTDLKGPVTRYGFDFAVAVDELRLRLNPDGTRSGIIAWRVAAFDSYGKPLNMVGKGSHISLSPAEYANFRRVGLQIHEELDAPRNSVPHFRAGIYDPNSGKAGTVSISARLVPRAPRSPR